MKNLFMVFFAMTQASFAQTITRIPATISFNESYRSLLDKANNLQLGVIGNNFYRKDSIGFSRAENGEGPNFYTDTWYPLDGMKRTFRATLVRISQNKTTKLRDGYYDDDQHWRIKPDAEYQELFQKGIREANRLAGASPSRTWVDFVGEIDLIDAQGEDYFSVRGSVYRNRFRLAIGDKVCAYGPFVGDADHGYEPELHPMEQFWWKKQYQPYSFNLFLNGVCDASGRYDNDNNFDTNDGTYSPIVKWAPHPLNTTFAIAFKIPFKNPNARTFITIKPASTYYTYQSEPLLNDGKIHHLLNGNDTVITVYEPNVNFIPDALSVSFDKLSLKGNLGADKDTLTGFIVLQSKLGIGSSPGHIFLNAEQETVSKNNYRVIMKSIRRINFNSGKFYAKGAIVPIEEKIVQLNISKARYGSLVFDQFVLDIGQEMQLSGPNIFVDFRHAFSPGEVIGSYFMNFRKNDITNFVSVRNEIQKSLIYNKSSYDGTMIIRPFNTTSPREGFFEIKYQVMLLTTITPNPN